MITKTTKIIKMFEENKIQSQEESQPKNTEVAVAAHGKKKTYAIVIDISGSMNLEISGTKTRFEFCCGIITNSENKILEDMKGGDVWLIFFNNHTSRTLIENLDDNGIEGIKLKIKDTTPTNNTALYDTMIDVLEMHKITPFTRVLFLTDGEDTSSTRASPQKFQQALDEFGAVMRMVYPEGSEVQVIVEKTKAKQFSQAANFDNEEKSQKAVYKTFTQKHHDENN